MNNEKKETNNQINESITGSRAEATFQLCIRDFSKFRESKESRLSPEPCVVRNLPWKILAMSKQLNEGVELAVRPFCSPEHYWDVYFGTLENGGSALLDAGIMSPTNEHKVFIQKD